MPEFVSIVYTYACSICGAKHKDAREDKARLKALRCEEKGTGGFVHVFQSGDVVQMGIGKNFDGLPVNVDVRIIRQGYVPKTHTLMYEIKMGAILDLEDGVYTTSADSLHRGEISGIQKK